MARVDSNKTCLVFRAIISLVIAITFLVCAGPGVTVKEYKVIENTKTYDFPFNEVWEALMATLTKWGIPIQTVEKESGILVTDFELMSTEELERVAVTKSRTRSVFGEKMFRGGRRRFNFHVRSIKESATVLEIITHIEGLAKYGHEGWEVWHSNGTLEKEIFKTLETQLQKR